MEIPDTCIIEAGMKCLQSPSYFSRFFPVSIENSYQVYSFWKWGAVIVAFLATFTRLLKQIEYLIVHIRRIKPSPESLLQHLDVGLDLSDDDDDDDDDDYEASNCTSADESDDPKTPSSEDYLDFYTDFRIKGSSNYLKVRGRNSGVDFKKADYSTGKNVVKIWDKLGFDYFDDSSDSDSVVSLWDFNKEQEIKEIVRRSPQISSTAVTSSSSPTVVLSAKMDDGVILEAYDTRAKTQSPVSYADWGPLRWPMSKEVTVTSGGVDKVYVGDVAAGDMRKLKTPLVSDGN